MEERLNALLNSTSPNEAELLSEEFAEFAAGAELPDEAAHHILSSVMRKAGSEMNDNITMTKGKRKKRGKRLFILIAAVLMIILGTIGAGAYYLNKQGIINGMNLRMWNIKEATDEELEVLNGMTSTKGKIIENTFEEIDVSYDGVVCDGNQMLVIFTLKKKDGTPLKAPEGYEWRAAFVEEDATLYSFSGKIYRNYLSDTFTENEDGSLSFTQNSFVYNRKLPFINKQKIGFNSLYCVPKYPLDGVNELNELSCDAENDYYHNDDNGEAATAKFFEALEKYSAEYFTGNVCCEADTDGVAVSPKQFVTNYKGEKMNVSATPLYIDLQCVDITLFSEDEIKHENWEKIHEERHSSIELFYKDGTSENANCISWGSDGNAQRFAFSCAYSTGKPMVISKIDYIVFDGEKISFAEAAEQ